LTIPKLARRFFFTFKKIQPGQTTFCRNPIPVTFPPPRVEKSEES
jgi:hypothetical protein